MHSRAIAASTLWQLVSQAVTMVIGILGIKFVTMGLSQSLVGNYQTVYSYLQLFAILADFGLYAVAIRELSSTKDFPATFGAIFFLRAGITVLSLGSAVLLAWMLPIFSGTPLPIGISIAIFVPFFTLLAGMLRTVFQVHYRMEYVFLSEVVSRFVPVCLMAIVLLLGVRQSEQTPLLHLFLMFGGIGSFVLFLLSLWFSRGLLKACPVPNDSERSEEAFWCGDCPRFVRGEIVRILKLAAPYGLAFFATTIYRQGDVTLIALLRPHDYDVQNAFYGTALRLAEIGFLLPTFLLNSALPVISDRRSRGEDIAHFLGQLLLALLVLGSVLSLFSFFWARPIILLLTRETYVSTSLAAGADTALQLLSFSMFLGMMITFSFYLLLSLHSWRKLLLLTFSAAALSILLNFFLIPLLGFEGAAITSIIVHLFLASGLLIVALHKMKVSIPFFALCRWFAFSLSLGLTLFATRLLLTNSWKTLLGGMVVLLFTGVLLVIFRLVPRSVVSMMGGKE